MLGAFVNRIEELRFLNKTLKSDGKECPVLVFTGIGGMGKTALRIALEEQILKPNNIPYAVLDYDGDPNLRPIEATLRAIRRQLGRQKVKTPVFDFLYARYFELSTGLKLSDKNFPPELEGVVKILEGIPGVGNVTQVLHGLSQLGLVTKERMQHKEWLYRIRDLEPRDVLNLLPEVLAEDLEEAMLSQPLKVLKDSGCRISLLLDAYERLSDSHIDETLHRKLFLLTPHLLRVIFTRTPLPWEHTFSQEWQGKITHFPSLDDLSHEDATMLLRKKHIDNPDLQEHMCQLTGGYPLHLELCADICREIKEITLREPEIQDFEGAAQAKDLTEELVNRLLRQLTDNERDLMELAVYPRWVSEEILEVLSSIPESVPRIFKKFTRLSMFSPHAEIPDAYVIRKEVRDCLMQRQRQERLFTKQHRKLSQFHRERWEESQAFPHLREALYHGFYENPDEAMRILEEHFWQLLKRFNYAEAEGLLEAIPMETLNEQQKRKVDYAQARFLASSSCSQHGLRTAKQLYEALIVSETNENTLGEYLLYLGDLLCNIVEYKKALEYLQKALSISLKVFGENHTRVAESYFGIGNVYDCLGEYGKALEYYEKALAIRIEIHGEEHYAIARSYNNIGNAYWRKGDYRKALEHHQKALAIRLKVFGEEHPAVAKSYNNIGMICRTLGEYRKALEYHGKALAIRLKVYGEDHYAVARSYNNIGNVYCDNGEPGRALEQHQKALAIWLKVFGEEHPAVAKSYNNIGMAYYRQGDHRKALEHHHMALAIRLKVNGEEHPAVARSYNNISMICHTLGEYSKGLEHHEKALTILLKVFGEEHPDIAESYRGAAHILQALKKNEEAFAKLQCSTEIYCKFRLWKNVVENLETRAGWLEKEGRKTAAEEARTEVQKIRKDHGIVQEHKSC